MTVLVAAAAAAAAAAAFVVVCMHGQISRERMILARILALHGFLGCTVTVLAAAACERGENSREMLILARIWF